MTNKYKCTDHKINLCCLGCVNAWISRHNALLEYVKKQASLEKEECNVLALAEAGYRVETILDARKLLRELGELC